MNSVMKKLLIFALSMGLIGPAIAQVASNQKEGTKKEVRKAPKITPEQYAQRKVDVLSEKVQLTDEQKKRAFEVYMQTAPQRIGAIGHDAATINEINKVEEDNIQKILTVDQKAHLARIKEQQKQEAIKLQQQRESNRSATEEIRKPLSEDLK